MATLRMRLKKQGKRLVHGYETATRHKKGKITRRKLPKAKAAKRLKYR